MVATENLFQVLFSHVAVMVARQKTIKQFDLHCAKRRKINPRHIVIDSAWCCAGFLAHQSRLTQNQVGQLFTCGVALNAALANLDHGNRPDAF